MPAMATSTDASKKASNVDLSNLFVADKAARADAAAALAQKAKNEGVLYFQEIGLTAALVKVSSDLSSLSRQISEKLIPFLAFDILFIIGSW